MADNVVQLEVDLRKARAELEAGAAQVNKLKESLKGANDRIKEMERGGSAAFQKQTKELKTTASEAEKTASKIRSLGGALNQIGGTGTGQIAQVAGALGMLTTPMGAVVAATGLAALAWKAYTDAEEQAIETTKRNMEAQKQIAAEIKKTNEEKSKIAVGAFGERRAAVGVAGETNVRRLEKMGDIYGTSRVDTYKIAETLAGAMVGKSEEQIQMLAGSIQALRALGFKPGEAAGKLKSNEAALRQAFSDPAKAAQRVLREETGRTTPLEEVRKRIVEGASSVEFQQEVLRTKAENAPAPSQKQTRLQTMLAEQASTERQFPGITEAAKKRGELQTKSIVAAREFREAAGFQEDLTNLPAWLTWTGVLYGSKVNRLKGESEAAKSELEGFDKATKQTAPYLTPQVLKAFEENTRAIEILTRSLNTNSDKTAENTSAQGQGMSK